MFSQEDKGRGKLSEQEDIEMDKVRLTSDIDFTANEVLSSHFKYHPSITLSGSTISRTIPLAMSLLLR